MLRDGASSFHAPARWLRVFILDFFFLGTATVVSLDEMGCAMLAAPTAFAHAEADQLSIRRSSVRGSALDVTLELVERGPSRIGVDDDAVARVDVAVDAAHRAQAAAVGPAQR
jgi:hypothetical protein